MSTALRMGSFFGMVPFVPPLAPCTWNPFDKAVNMNLSEADLYVDKAIGGNVWRSVRGTVSKATQKSYIEIEVAKRLGEIDMSAGLAPFVMSLYSYCGQTIDSYSIIVRNHWLTNNGVSVSLGATLLLSDRICIAYDPVAHKVWLGVNGDYNGGNPALGTGASFSGVQPGMFPCASIYNDIEAEAWRMHANDASFLYPIPAGFIQWAAAEPPEYDPYFSNVVALLHFQGADNSDVFTDVKAHSFSRGAAVNIYLDTSSPILGQSSLYSTGSGIAGVYALSSDFIIGTGDFTVEIFFKAEIEVANVCVFSNLPGGTHVGTIGATAYVQAAGSNGFYIQNNDTASFVGGLGLVVGQHYHLTICREAGVLRVYLNGVSIFSVADTRNLTSNETYVNQGYATSSMRGWMAEYRFTNGFCRYPGGTTFSVPPVPFPNAGPPASFALRDSILALSPWAYWLLDETNAGGGTLAADASGNARPLTLSGPGASTMREFPALVTDSGKSYRCSQTAILNNTFGNFADDSAVGFFCVFKLTSLAGGSGSGNGLCHLGDTSFSGGQGIFLYVNPNGSVTLQLFSGGYQTWTSAAGVVANDVKYTVGFTHDPVANVVKIYLNGAVLLSSAWAGGFAVATCSTIGIGKLNVPGENYLMTGYVDHPVIFASVISDANFANLHALANI